MLRRGTLPSPAYSGFSNVAPLPEPDRSMIKDTNVPSYTKDNLVWIDI